MISRVEYPFTGSIGIIHLVEILNRTMWCARKNIEVEITPSNSAFNFDFKEAKDAVLFKMRWS